ncbi:ABC transporter permease [Brevundimonas sp. Root1279]|uniref:ABC transporter permease n=1 Tax=Brevundimonas sp. Root1279 TaxID=1736443 RepID=UPI0006FB67BE|nr:ABC transporter permease [Brevundimonas sp. Root1279]KQW79583.1 sodium export permease [Brevundimonas sp. Root1279]
MSRILLIARREFAAYAKTVGFWLSLLAFPIFAVIGGAVPLLIQSSEPVRSVAVVEEGPQAAGLALAVRQALADEATRADEGARKAAEEAAKVSPGMTDPAVAQGAISAMSKPSMKIVAVPPAIAAAAPGEARDEAARAHLVEEGDGALDAVVLLDRNAAGEPTARVWTARATDDKVSDFVRAALKSSNQKTVFTAAGIDPAVVDRTEAFRPEVKSFSPKARDGEVSFRDRLPMIMGLAGGFILWSLVITGASILLNSVMEEKSNKILEVLLSSASATEILTGKVLGVALLTLTVMLAWGGLGLGSLAFFQPTYVADIGGILLHGGMLWWFVAFMVGGYLMYAVLFAAIGAFCETPRDAQTLMGPIMMVLVIPIMTMTMAIESPDAPVIKALSWVPFFTPFLMMARLPSDPPMYELVGSMVGMFAFALLMVWLAGRAFRAGALSDVKLSWKAFAAAMGGGR